MKFFNVDLHCSVIEDTATQFKKLGHEVDSHLMSGHHWVTGREQVKRGEGGKVGIGSLTTDNWEALFADIADNDTAWGNISNASKWAAEVADELHKYDGYIVTYPPAFAMLYERPVILDSRKRIIMNMPIRYEGPSFAKEPEQWRRFNDWIAVMIDNNLLVPVANSRYDAAYFEYFTGRKATYISSTCDYVDKFAPKWSPRGGKVLLAFGEHAGCRKAQELIPRVKFVRDVLGGRYLHSELVRSPGIVWIPYNCSVMSFFEHYWLNIPMFVPTQKFLSELTDEKLAMSQLSWRPTESESPLPRAATDLCDPMHDDARYEWTRLYDFYNEAEFPHLIYFDSWDELREQIESYDIDKLRLVSAAMAAHNKVREWRNIEKWKMVLDNTYTSK